MSIDSKLFISCNKEDTLSIGNSVSKAFSEYARTKLDDYWKNNTDAQSRVNFMWSDSYKDQNYKFTNGVSISTHDFESFRFVFGCGDEQKRSLSMFTTCSSDHEDIQGDYKVIFSIGYWGSYDEILMVVAESVKEFGDVYYDFNDCDDLDFIKL